MRKKSLERIVLLASTLWEARGPEVKAFGDYKRQLGFGLIANQVNHLSKRRNRTANGRAPRREVTEGRAEHERGLSGQLERIE